MEPQLYSRTVATSVNARSERFQHQLKLLTYRGRSSSKVVLAHICCTSCQFDCTHSQRLNWAGAARVNNGRCEEEPRVPGSLFATSDLHSSFSENRRLIDEMHPESSD